MSEYFKFLRQLLALSGESFEDELRRFVILILFSFKVDMKATSFKILFQL